MASLQSVVSAVRPRSPVWTAHGALLATAVFWGTNVPLMKIGLLELHPFAFNALRLPLSAALLGVLVLFENHGARQRPLDARTLLRVAVVGLLASLLYQVLFVTGLARTTAASVGFIIASAPLWTALIARAFGVERIDRLAWIGLAAAAAGAAVITLNGGVSELGRGSLVGNLLVVAAVMTWASSTVFSKTIVGGVSPTRLAFLMTAFMVPLHVALGWQHLGPVWQGEISPLTWLCVAFSGLLSTGWGYALWYFGVRHVGPSHTAVYASLVPVITLLGAVWLLAESVSLWQIAGGGLVLLGVAVMQRFRNPVGRP